MHQGTFYRLKSPFEGNDTAWMTVSEDLEQAVAAYYQVLNPANAGWLRLKLQGLHEDMLYQVSMPGKTGEYYGSELMYAFPLTEVISLKNQGILLLFSFLLRKKPE
uniref:GH36 C-terminal domain-containing protein n=1 Tax=Clostridium sp. NkU-1 TaxID=1095009 RepID=UPI0006D00DE0